MAVTLPSIGAALSLGVWAAENGHRHVGFWPHAGEVAGLVLIGLGFLVGLAIVRGLWLPGGFEHDAGQSGSNSVDSERRDNLLAAPAVRTRMSPPAEQSRPLPSTVQWNPGLTKVLFIMADELDFEDLDAVRAQANISRRRVRTARTLDNAWQGLLERATDEDRLVLQP